MGNRASQLYPRLAFTANATARKTAKRTVAAPAVLRVMPMSERMAEGFQQYQSLPQPRDLIPVPFGPWRPDEPDLGNSMTVATNVIPDANSYRPFMDLEAATDALSARCLGALGATDSTGTHYLYAGDASKLYEVGRSAVTDRSDAGGYSVASDDVWRFTTFGTNIIATNGTNEVQGMAVGGSVFADWFSSTDTPTAKDVATVRDFLVLGYADAVPVRVRWSAAGDSTDMDEDATTQSDKEDLVEGGAVQRVMSGVEYGLVFQEGRIVRMSYIGPDSIFQFDPIDRTRGTPIPNSVVALGRLVYFISEEGFFLNDGAQSYPIGQNQVDRTFWGQFDVASNELVTASIDPLNKLVVWGFPIEGSANAKRLYMFNWEDRRWGQADIEVELLLQSRTRGYTLEELDTISTDIETLTPTLDSPLWKGGALQFAAFDSDHKLAHFTGDTLQATLETGEHNLFPGRHAMVNELWPLVDGGTITAAVAGRERLLDSISYDAAGALDATGKVPVRNESRYHRFKTVIGAGSTWTHAQGVNIGAQPMGAK